jgi:GT2 family glycosyltransferase
VVVTDGWLDQLVALAEIRGTTERGGAGDLTTEGTESTDGDGGDASDRAVLDGGEQTTKETKHTKKEISTRESCGIGLVGPMSNYAAPPQLVEGVPYRDMEEMQAFARRWREEHRGQWFTAGKLSGFCLLMKRAVYEAVGGLDERFGMGLFDDDDLALRARQAGFELAMAHDLFVHHFGSRTFAGNGVDAEKLLEQNRRLFAEKWGDVASRGRQVMLRPWMDGKTQNEPRMNTDSHGWEGRETSETGPSKELSDPLRSYPCQSVLLMFKIFEPCADFLTFDGDGSYRKRRNFGAHSSLSIRTPIRLRLGRAAYSGPSPRRHSWSAARSPVRIQ